MKISEMDIQDFPIARVQTLNWLFVFALTVAGGLSFSLKFAEGVLIGGLIASVSFVILKNDLLKIIQGPVKAVKVLFFIKYYARLSVLAIVLFFLVKHWQINIFGLLVGLSAVVLSILTVGVSLARKFYISAKEAV